MYTLNSLAIKPTGKCPPFNPHRQSFSKSLSTLSFRTTLPPLSHVSHSTVKASSPNHSKPKHPNKSQNILEPQIDNYISKSIPFKSTLITTITAAAFFLSGFHFSLKPSLAAPIPPPLNVESAATKESTPAEEKETLAAPIPPPLNVESAATKESTPPEEKERLAEEQLYSNSDDIEELKNAVEIKVKSRKIPEAIKILDKLTELQPDEIEWTFLRAHLYAHNGELQLARKVFHEMLNKNPSSLDACQGLVNVDAKEESVEELRKTEKRIEEAIRITMENTENTADLRDFKILLAEIRVLEGRLDDALNSFKELEKEEPGDFRVHLCQVLVYTLLNRKSEAENSLEKYKRLVPEGNFFDNFFDDNDLKAAKAHAQKVKNERE